MTRRIRLDRVQREAIRREIRMISSEAEDVPRCFEPGRDGLTDRAFVVATIAKLERWVAVFDAIGWLESSGAPGEQDVIVDPDLAMWARGQATEIEHSFHDDFHVTDADLDALGVLRLIAGATSF
jgi:hypothetical protein